MLDEEAHIQESYPDTEPVLNQDSKSTAQEASAKPQKHWSVLDASIFLDRLSSVDYPTLPISLQTIIRNTLTDWSDGDISNRTTDFKDLLQKIKTKIDKAQNEESMEIVGLKSSTETQEMKRKIAVHPPLEFPLTGKYSPEELMGKFPKGIELQNQLGNDIEISVYNDCPKLFYIIEGLSGEKETLRIVSTSRTLEQINEDLRHQPEGLPKLKAVRFQDGTIGILTEWIGGRLPNMKVQSDIDLCVNAANTLISVPWEVEHERTVFDLNYTNFKIRKEQGNQEKAYYIDSDIPELIIKRGLSAETSEQRQSLLQEAKARHFR